MILFHSEVSCHGTSVKVQYGSSSVQVLIVADTPSISGAVIRRYWLQFYIWFICFLIVHSSFLAAAVLYLMPYALPSLWSGLVLALLVSFPQLVSCFCFSPCPLLVCHSGLLQPFYTMTLAMHAGIACLHFACWDSISGFALACWDSMSWLSWSVVGYFQLVLTQGCLL